MSFLDFLDRIPDKIFPQLKPKIVNGFLFFPFRWCREIFHIVGSFVLIIISYILYLHVYKNAPIIVFALLGVWMTYQEFYLHPKKYNQKLLEGMFDWSSWIIPFIIYLIFLYKL